MKPSGLLPLIVGLALSLPLSAKPVIETTPGEFIPFPDGQLDQQTGDFSYTYDKNYNLIVGTASFSNNTYLLANLSNANTNTKDYPKDYAAAIYEYDFNKKSWRRLGNPFTEGHCYRGTTVSQPVKKGGSYQVAAVANTKMFDDYPCKGSLTSKIWQDEQWHQLSLDGFKLNNKQNVLPYAFAKNKPEWLLGRLIPDNSFSEIDMATGLGIWQYNAQTEQYEPFTLINFPNGYVAPFENIISFSDDGTEIEIALKPEGNSSIQGSYSFRYVYNPNTKKFDVNYSTSAYTNYPIGHYPPLKASLIMNIVNNTGAYWYDNGQLSPGDEFKFETKNLVAKDGSFGYRSNSYCASKGIFFSNPSEGLYEDNCNPMVFQSGKTRAPGGAPGFQLTNNYLLQQCDFTVDEVPFNHCSSSADLVITEVNGLFGYGSCLNRDRVTATEKKKRTRRFSLDDQGGGIFWIDLSNCPSLPPASFIQ